VTITGSHLTGAATPTFDGVPATHLLVVDDGTVTATAPAHLDGAAVDVVVSTPGGSDSLVAASTFTP
jgi:hypothetical protein